MKFDPDSDYAKHRDANGGVWLIQNGRKYSPSGILLGKDESIRDKNGDTTARAAIRQRAAEKLVDFSGKEAKPGTIADALAENRKAEQAEAHAE